MAVVLLLISLAAAGAGAALWLAAVKQDQRALTQAQVESNAELAPAESNDSEQEVDSQDEQETPSQDARETGSQDVEDADPQNAEPQNAALMASDLADSEKSGSDVERIADFAEQDDPEVPVESREAADSVKEAERNEDVKPVEEAERDEDAAPVELSDFDVEELDSDVAGVDEVTEADVVEVATAVEQADGTVAEYAAENAAENVTESEVKLAAKPAAKPASKEVAKAAAKAAALRDKLHLPGALRRERKAWAAEKHFEFVKSDSYLEGEWHRGAAAGGAVPRDIVAGNAYGHELLLMDLGGTNVMAMRTGATSDVVIDFRREGVLELAQASEDLVEAFRSSDFAVWANEPAVALRMRDVRVDVALERMPAQVTGLWMESEWVLAQMTRAAEADTWEALLAPLALLADAARTLPPRPSSGQALRIDGGDPTRLQPPTGGMELTGVPALPVVDEEFEHPPVQRPDEPLVMPTRLIGDTLGDFDHELDQDFDTATTNGASRPGASRNGASRNDASRDGDDAFLGDAFLGDFLGDEDTAADAALEAGNLGRMPRALDHKSSIFDDASPEDVPGANWRSLLEEVPEDGGPEGDGPEGDGPRQLH